MTAEFVDKIDALRQISQLKLTKVLDSIPGRKDLIIENHIMKPLERFIGVKVLKSHGVEKIYKLAIKEVTAESPSVVYLIRGDLVTGKRVCDQINALGGDRKYHVIVVPQSFHSIEALVEEEGLFGKVKFHSFGWELIQLDTRILSLESPEAFKFFFVAKDPTYALPVATSLWSLQHIFGTVPFKMFIGPNSKSLNSLMGMLDENRGAPDYIGSDIGFLLVVDRDVDYASALLTPGTYTSLVDSVLGIVTGVVQVPKSKGDEKEQVTTMMLTGEDETYSQCKHRHFSDVILYLKQEIAKFQQNQARRHNMSVQEMRDFVQNDLSKAANTGKILTNHLHICESVTSKIGQLFEGIQTCQHDILVAGSRRESITFIEELMATGVDFHLVLRFISLLSLCQGGLSQSEASTLKMQFFHAYGHEHILTFHNLEKMGLFSTNATAADVPTKLASKVVQVVSLPRKGAFQITAAKLKLFPEATENYSLKDPQDPGYVFGGIYIPLIAQVVSIVLKKEKPLRELMKLIPGDSNNVVVSGRALDFIADVNPRCILVYVVGGITYAEVAALALIEKKTGCRIVCAGSSIINGNSLTHSAVS